MIRYSTISTLGDCNFVTTADPVQVVGSYVVDDSAFVPLSEAVKNVSAGAVSPAMVKTMYDFADGKDDGSSVPVDRTHSFTGDIAEVSQLQRKASEKVAKDFGEYLQDKVLDDKLQAINNGQVDSSSSNGNQ